MAVNAKTIETYDNSVIREDLEEQYSMISPEEVPFQTMIGRGDCDSTYHEWPTVELADPDATNRVIEGDDDPAVDDGTLAERLGNYTQISDKVVKVSHTSEAVDAAAEDIQRLAKQVALKIRELKRDMEVMLLQNIAASPAASGAARVTAGLPAFLRTNIVAGAGGTAPTLSGTTNGYPNAAYAPGTAAPFTETQFNDVIELCWLAGGNPTIAMVNANNKRIISETFTGSATRYKDAVDKTLVNAIDIYDSDFGELTVIPNRFQPALDFPATETNFAVFVLDPDFIELCWLESVKQKPLAETGHSRNKLVWCEYLLKVDNEASCGAIYDTDGIMPTP